MKKAVGNEFPSDRETWFKLVPKLQPQDKLTSDLNSVDGSEVQKVATMNELNDEDKINGRSSLESASDTEKKNADGEPREEALKENKDADYLTNDWKEEENLRWTESGKARGTGEWKFKRSWFLPNIEEAIRFIKRSSFTSFCWYLRGYWRMIEI